MNNDALEAYSRWLTVSDIPLELKAELTAIFDDPAAIEDRFDRDLEFGTGGLRGLLGAGTNRMNIFTVAKATQGLADYLNGLPGGAKSVAVAHDSRMNSRLFAETTAAVLAANGITAHLYPRLQPTPALSWAVRYLQCDAGVCITASHNPAAYNGYKVYGADGCQITTEAAKAIQAAIDGVDVLTGAKPHDYASACAAGLVRAIDETVLDAYLAAVLAQGLGAPGEKAPLKVVYTPLNGAGLECVSRTLKSIGVENVVVVPQQAQPDGNFPTCPYPNPEDPAALELGLSLCEEAGADLLLATDPDCDRVGVAVRDKGRMRLLSGNEVGILLLDYIAKTRLKLGKMPKNPVAVSTIVSTGMANPVCQKYGIEMRRTLTGFKFIGEQIGLLEKNGEESRFIFGFEESCGHLSGSHVRDKDAVNASMLICQMARYYKAQCQTLAQALAALYDEYGFYKNSLFSFTFEGPSGTQTMGNLMAALRKNPPRTTGELAVLHMEDYATGANGLPPANMLKIVSKEDCWLAVRPSGTEPKIKFYCAARADTESAAAARLKALEQWVNEVTCQC